MDKTVRLEDDAIIGLYFSRDESAIQETDKAYGRELFQLSWRILSNWEDAEENRSDTYLSAWNAMPPARPRRLAAFLHRICRNHALNRLDRRKAKRRNVQVVELTKELSNCIPGGNVEEEVDARELGKVLSEFMRQLSEEELFILTTRCFYMERIREISRELGYSEGQVRTTLYRLRLKLKEYLEQNWA